MWRGTDCDTSRSNAVRPRVIYHSRLKETGSGGRVRGHGGGATHCISKGSLWEFYTPQHSDLTGVGGTSRGRAVGESGGRVVVVARSDPEG